MSPYERIKLCQQIVVMRKGPKPKTWKQISAALDGIPERTLQYMLAHHDGVNDLHEDPLGVIEETLQLYDSGIEVLSDLAVNADSDAVQVGAARSMLSAAKGRLELLVAIGKVPSRLGAYAEQRDLDRVFGDMGQVLKRHNASADMIRDLLVVVSGGQIAEERRQLADTGSIDADFYEDDDEDA